MGKFHRDLTTDDQILTWAQSLLWVIASDDAKQSHDDFSVPIGRLENLLDHTIELIMQKRARQIAETQGIKYHVEGDDIPSEITQIEHQNADNDYNDISRILDTLDTPTPQARKILDVLAAIRLETGGGADWVTIKEKIKEDCPHFNVSPPVMGKLINELIGQGFIAIVTDKKSGKTKKIYKITGHGFIV